MERYDFEGATFGRSDVMEYVTLVTEKLNVDRQLTI